MCILCICKSVYYRFKELFFVLIIGLVWFGYYITPSDALQIFGVLSNPCRQ